MRHGTWRLRAIRWAERWLSGVAVGAGVEAITTAAKFRESRRDGRPIAACQALAAAWGTPVSRIAYVRDRARVSAANFVWRWPERLRTPRWRRRCTFENESILRDALATGRPVIVATLHFGGVVPLYHWLRSRGLPIATLSVHRRVGPIRDALDTLGDHANGLVGVPRLFGTEIDDLKDAGDFLRAAPGRGLIVAMDGGGGAKPVEVAVDGVTFTLRLGAFRMAEMLDAIVVPVLFHAGPAMRCAIHVGQPVPAELIRCRKRHAEAAACAIRELLPVARRSPAQFDACHLPRPDGAAKAFAPQLRSMNDGTLRAA